MNQKVAVIGTGRMGSALAAALLNKGFARQYGIAQRQKLSHCPGWECTWRRVF